MFLGCKDQSSNGDLTVDHKKILTRRWYFASALELLGYKPVANMLVQGFLRWQWKTCLCGGAGCSTVAPKMPLK